MMRVCAAVVFLSTGTVVAKDNQPEPATAGAEHKFLQRFVGDWECENEAFYEPGKPAVKSKGSMTGRMIGDYWAVVVVRADALGQPYQGQATFGFDSLKKKKYIGTWADSMSAFLWKYEGIADGDKLILNSEGPNPSDPDKMIKARDTWEFKNKDLILLTGEMEGPEGKLMTVMKATCRRKK